MFEISHAQTKNTTIAKLIKMYLIFFFKFLDWKTT